MISFQSAIGVSELKTIIIELFNSKVVLRKNRMKSPECQTLSVSKSIRRLRNAVRVHLRYGVGLPRRIAL